MLQRSESRVLDRPRIPASRIAQWLYQRGLLYGVVVALALIFGFPFLWTLSSSLKTGPEMGVYPPVLFPAIPQWSNYAQVFTVFRYPIARWFLNSLFLVVANTVGVMLTSAAVAFGFARFRFRGKELLFLITLSTMMVPSQVTLIPQFILFHRLGWIDTLKPLWVPSWFGGGAFNIFLLRQFFQTLPMELDEAAKIDGASSWRTFWSVLIPLCGPVLATVAIISFMGRWSEFLGPVIYLNDIKKYTVAVGLRFLSVNPEASAAQPLIHILMAATVLSVIPCIVVFFAGQSYFVRGVVTTGIKG
jgi:multiple sugar transport system permease protein